MLPAVVVAAGSSIAGIFGFLFRASAIKLVVTLAFFALISVAGYFAADALLPDFVSVSNLNAQVQSFSPPVAYGLHLLAFYDGFKLMLIALVSAWIVKKLPAWVWFGPLYRLLKK